MSNSRPRDISILRILKNDYLATLMLIFVGVSWGLTIGAVVYGVIPKARGGTIEMDPTGLAILYIVSVLISILCLSILIMRIRMLARVIRLGSEGRAKLSRIWFAKDRGRVEFTYEYEGIEFIGGSAIFKNNETLKLQEGDILQIRIDTRDPKRAFMEFLFTKQ